jgi:hypothetical protein
MNANIANITTRGFGFRVRVRFHIAFAFAFTRIAFPSLFSFREEKEEE